MQRRLLILCFSILIAIAVPALAQTQRPGIGVWPYEGGTTFRVWAPNALEVHVGGTFNDWSHSASPLTAEGGGMWAADVEGALVGHEFRYVIRHAGGTVTRRDPRSRLVTTSHYTNGNSIIYDPDAFEWTVDPLPPHPIDDLVIYEMHIGTFAARPGGSPGNFRTALLPLDHLADLGVTAVKVLPVSEFIGRFSGGYNPSDIYSVHNRAYGGPDAFKEFVQQCHARGIAVILDVVYNHWGPWDLATHQFDGWHTPQWPGGIYFYDADRIESPWGPRPNFSEPRVREFIHDNLRMWLDEYRIDGFRWDSTSNIYNTHNGQGRRLPDGARLIREANFLMRRHYPGVLNIAEDLRNDDRLTAPLSQGGGGFDSQWHWFVAHIRQEVIRPQDSQRNMHSVRHAIESTHNGDFRQRVIYSESHNETCSGSQRLTRLIDPNDPDSWSARKRSTLAAAVMFTSPGIPMIWQGQEFVDQAPFDPRQPLDWRRREQHSGIVNLYRDLIHLRRNLSGTTAGLKGTGLNVHHVNNTAKVIAYHRWCEVGQGCGGRPGDDVIVIANFTAQPRTDYQIGFPYPGLWRTRFNSDAMEYAPDFTGIGSAKVPADGPPRDGLPHSGRVTVGAYSVLVLTRE